MADATEYDPRYLAGIELFNHRDFFEAHEVWEDLWHDTAGPERRFYQGLIQAAVAAYHAGNGNGRGARRLFHSGRNYMSTFSPVHLGLDVSRFWSAMQRALTDFLVEPSPENPKLDTDALPKIELTPESRPR